VLSCLLNCRRVWVNPPSQEQASLRLACFRWVRLRGCVGGIRKGSPCHRQNKNSICGKLNVPILRKGRSLRCGSQARFAHFFRLPVGTGVIIRFSFGGFSSACLRTHSVKSSHSFGLQCRWLSFIGFHSKHLKQGTSTRISR